MSQSENSSVPDGKVGRVKKKNETHTTLLSTRLYVGSPTSSLDSTTFEPAPGSSSRRQPSRRLFLAEGLSRRVLRASGSGLPSRALPASVPLPCYSLPRVGGSSPRCPGGSLAPTSKPTRRSPFP